MLRVAHIPLPLLLGGHLGELSVGFVAFLTCRFHFELDSHNRVIKVVQQ